MGVQKLKFEAGVNSEVEQHSVSFLEDSDFTPLLLNRRKQICLLSVWIRKGEGLKKRNIFNTSCSLTQALHKYILSWAADIRAKPERQWKMESESMKPITDFFLWENKRLKNEVTAVQPQISDKNLVI